MSKQGKEEYGKCEDKIRKVPTLEDRKMGWMDGWMDRWMDERK